MVLTKLAGTQITSVLRNREDYQAAIKAHKHASAELTAMQKRVRRESITSINLADQSTKLRVLLNFASLSAAVNDVGSLVTLVCKDAASVLDAHATALYLADSNATRLISITADPGDSGIAFGEGIVGHVAVHHAPVQWNAQTSSSPDLTTAEVQQLGIRPMYVLTVPLRDAHDNVAGVFQVRIQ